MSIRPNTAAPRGLDRVMPTFDVNEVHHRRIAAPIEVVWAAVRTLSPAEIRVLAPLMALRAVPVMLSRGSARNRWRTRDRSLSVWEMFEREGFSVIDEQPPANGRAEIVAGAIGRFWSMSDPAMVRFTTADEFLSRGGPNSAKTAFDMAVYGRPDGGCDVTTETRIVGTDAEGTRHFRRYWRVIHPGSAWIRRSWLAGVARRVSEETRAGTPG